MATDQVLHGLDKLELGSVQGRRSVRLARAAWAAAWPKLLAIALVLAVWQIVHLTGWKHFHAHHTLHDLWSGHVR